MQGIPVTLHPISRSLFDPKANRWVDAKWGMSITRESMILTVVDSKESPVFLSLPMGLVNGITDVVMRLREEVTELDGGLAVLEEDFEKRIKLIELKLDMISNVLKFEIDDREEFDG